MTLSRHTPSAPPAARRWRDRALIAGLLGLVGLGLAGLASATGWRETLAQIARLHLWQIAALLGLSLANYLMRSARWHLLARRLGLPTTLAQDIRHYLGGFAMSVTPGRVGELVRMRWLRRETGWAIERSAPLALMDRAGDLAAMGLILALAVSLAAGGIAGALPVTLLALAAAVVATRPRLLAALVTLAYRALGRFPRLFARARAAARSLARFSHGPTLGLVLTLGLMGWMAEGYAFHLLLGWMGAEIGLWKAIAIFVFATLAGGLTGAPGGLGGAEAAMVALLSLDGVPLEISVPATAVIRLTTLWFAIAIGLATFPLAERASLKAQEQGAEK
ncbi:MAG: YbhN family protein [Paenirhodobacter sp.]|uniref:lysylphosphatidylglycerol synthase transmembrane domain-containing protein n=1 Tax=Paenirhodobacter sp. TaxID=1965326 RepID=UPI003D115681